MGMNLAMAKKSGKAATEHLQHLLLFTDRRDEAINAIDRINPLLADLSQEVKECDQLAYSRRQGTDAQAKAVARGIAFSDLQQGLLQARRALMEHYDICRSCFGKGQAHGWQCPQCQGNTYEQNGPRYHCVWCRGLFVPTTELQTYCTNCARYAPSARAAGLPEMEWRPIAVENRKGTHELADYVPLFCKQYECSACGGKGFFYRFVDDFDRPLAEPQQVQCGYCYPAENSCTVCGEKFTTEWGNSLLCPVHLQEAKDRAVAKEARYEAEHIDPVVPTPKELTSFGDFWGTNRTEPGTQKEGEAVVVTEDDWAAGGSPLVAHLKAELGTEPVDNRYWADEGRVDKPAISVAWQGFQIRINGPEAVYMGLPANVPTGDHEYAYNGWAYDWLGVVPVGQAYRVVMLEGGEVLGTFTTDQECAEFIYTTLQAGLTATVYAEPEAPATVPAQPQLPDRANQFIARLEAVEAKLDRVLGLLDPIAVLFAAERTALEAQVLAHGEAIGENTGAIMGLRDLLAALIPAVQAANVTIGPKPTDAQATALQAVERAVEAAEADPTEPCRALGCKNGLISLGQKCPACGGTGRVLKAQPVPADYQYMTPEGHYICDMCGTEYKKNHPLHRGLCAECLTAAEMLDGYVVGDEAGEWVKAEPSTTEPEEEKAPSYTAEQMIAMFSDPVHGRDWVEWAVWVLGNRQTEEEISAGGTLYENGVGFNGADSGFGTNLFNWLHQSCNQQPHLTPKQVSAAARMLKKYVSTQLLPALQHSCPHIPSSFKKGDWVEVTTWADQAKGPFQVEGHSWLLLRFVGGGMAAWYDCMAVEAPQQAVEAADDGLEDLEL